MHARTFLSRSVFLCLFLLRGSIRKGVVDKSADTQAWLPNVSCRVRRLGEAIVQKAHPTFTESRLARSLEALGVLR